MITLSQLPPVQQNLVREMRDRYLRGVDAGRIYPVNAAKMKTVDALLKNGWIARAEPIGENYYYGLWPYIWTDTAIQALGIPRSDEELRMLANTKKIHLTPQPRLDGEDA